MYVWLAIDVDNQLKIIKNNTLKIEKAIGFDNSNLTLPFHISLKISFFINKKIYDDIISDVSILFKSIKSFEIETDKIELDKEICWIIMKKNNQLNSIHDCLNELLQNKYNIPLHEYDKDYKFHTTLFMDNNENKVKKAYELIKDSYIPNKLLVNRFVIGTSENGKLGTYSVKKEILI